eukprot:GHVU01124429.1.p1 GENE.GHVU01124429.1~~GHVU01124429.1.p1  ORF type:complete len:281 (+),score=42.34 GHVU01124429.1:1008-1850(+)
MWACQHVRLRLHPLCCQSLRTASIRVSPTLSSRPRAFLILALSGFSSSFSSLSVPFQLCFGFSILFFISYRECLVRGSAAKSENVASNRGGGADTHNSSAVPPIEGVQPSKNKAGSSLKVKGAASSCGGCCPVSGGAKNDSGSSPRSNEVSSSCGNQGGGGAGGGEGEGGGGGGEGGEGGKGGKGSQPMDGPNGDPPDDPSNRVRRKYATRIQHLITLLGVVVTSSNFSDYGTMVVRYGNIGYLVAAAVSLILISIPVFLLESGFGQVGLRRQAGRQASS